MKKLLLLLLLATGLVSCKKDNDSTETPEEEFFVNEDPASFAEIASFKVGGKGAAEISAFDPSTNRLFVVNNNETENRIDVIDFKDPSKMTVIKSIPMLPYGGAVNSLSVYGGNVAAAIESTNKQANGKVVVFKTSDYSKVAEINVGALPDMVTYSPDGKYILTANEGEPSADYLNDPEGSISIITVADYSVVTKNFAAFAGQKDALQAKGFRIFGPSNDFVKDIEPEYITISEDSKTAWVTLQENNGIAKIDLTSKNITDIFPLGFKDYSLDGNEIDPSDKETLNYIAGKWPVKGIYMPDAIAVFTANNTPYLFTANEGDAREYTAFVEARRVKEITLSSTVFPNAADLKKEPQLGRLNITSTLGVGADGKYEALYSFGARSFSVWNGNTGSQIFDSKNELDVRTVAAGVYDDARSDDKSIEPEGLTIGKIGNKTVAFVGMERVDAVAIYDVTNPTKPVFLQIIKCGDAPEGVLIIPAAKSPTKKSLLVVSSEDDGTVKVYTPNTL
ncbi:choice-of-anchor I family protein [Mucilaginibacter terrae]|uniref:DNA-binding beta-propeller fold protein YncE n=1 Tax=Mucilaginibacter terrae TaxID=1955052 RepID=A0ABU3GP68_9SPHI|nr:choice-of-anchor I family protein [Mucilaginibacter terrae]MDT3401584.1 DNA-binding beta-propeller fold protein YncE [Mucilaginibacter terrae]